MDPYDPYVDYECHQLALKISKAETQGNSSLANTLYGYYDEFDQESLQNYFTEAVKPYLDVQNFVAQQAERVAAGDYDDVQALEYILQYALDVAGGDLNLALIYAASAFYRPQIGQFGGGLDYSYTYLTTARFGVSGFNSMFVGDSANNNQLQHFIGQAHIISYWGGNQNIGNAMVWAWDHQNTPINNADRELGYVASWWVSNPGTVNLAQVINILRNGG